MQGEIIANEVFSLTDRTVAAFEIDCENLQDDSEETVTQSFFIVTTEQEVY